MKEMLGNRFKCQNGYVDTFSECTGQNGPECDGCIVVEMEKRLEKLLPPHPIELEPVEAQPAPLAEILDGLYKTDDAWAAASLAASSDWIICDVIWDGGSADTWVLGRLKRPE